MSHPWHAGNVEKIPRWVEPPSLGTDAESVGLTTALTSLACGHSRVATAESQVSETHCASVLSYASELSGCCLVAASHLGSSLADLQLLPGAQCISPAQQNMWVSPSRSRSVLWGCPAGSHSLYSDTVHL